MELERAITASLTSEGDAAVEPHELNIGELLYLPDCDAGYGTEYMVCQVDAVSSSTATVKAADTRLAFQLQIPRVGINFPLKQNDDQLKILKYRMLVDQWLRQHGFLVWPATCNGNCLPVSAMRLLGIARPDIVRQRIVNYLESNREALPPLLLECIGTVRHPDINHLIAKIGENNCWFDEPALVALVATLVCTW